MAALRGEVFLKVGAEGVYVAALPRWRLGVALKMDAGSGPAAEVALSAILTRMGLAVPPGYARPAVTNRNGIVTGCWASADRAFDGVPALS